MKRILIPGGLLGETTFGVGRAYMEFISQWGDPVVLAPMKGIIEGDLLILPGGQDLLSHHYGQTPSYFNTNPDVMKEYFFLNNLPQYVESGIKIVGICLGMQQLNVYFGGSLTQNCYHPYSDKSRDQSVHQLHFTPKFHSLMRELKVDNKEDALKVNSLHHQGISRASDLSSEFETIAVGPYDVVECFKHKTRPILGFQYHAEEIYDKLSIHLIDELLNEESITESTTGANEETLT